MCIITVLLKLLLVTLHQLLDASRDIFQYCAPLKSRVLITYF